MGKSRWIAAAALAGGLAGMSGMAQAVTASVFVQLAPPAPRYEVGPPARIGYVWVPGHWQWQGHGHVWVHGYYLRERPGYVYAQPRWQRHGNRWGYAPGAWVQAEYGYDRHYGQYRHNRRPDRDRDGIPDRWDRDLDNDGRPNRYDRDRDGDGVPNYRDRAPDNRYRY